MFQRVTERAAGSPVFLSKQRHSSGAARVPSTQPVIQRYVGNSTLANAKRVQRACGCGGTCSSCAQEELESAGIQKKVAVGPVNDPYEREADRVAHSIAGGGTQSIGPAIQRLSSSSGGTGQADLALSSSGGRPLSTQTRSFMEPRFQSDFSQVHLHTGEQAGSLVRQVGARAFTYGSGIWLGNGESESDTRLMAHELTHVVQQGGARDLNRLQRDVKPPPPDPCEGKKKTIDIALISLPGSTRDPYADVARANTIWSQCCVTFNVSLGQSWQTNVLDTDAPNAVLNESADVTVNTTELTNMTAHRPGGDVIHVYFVPANSLGDRGGSYGYTGSHTALARSVSVTNIGAVDTLAHELGHVLLDDASHHADPDNLMATGAIRNVGVDRLEQAQCNRL